MSNLFALAAAGRTVEIQDIGITVVGINARAIAALLTRFPALIALIDGGELKLDNVATLGPDVIAAIIAAGTGSLGDEEAEKIADSLPLADQLELIEAIGMETFAGDAAGFLKRLESLAAGVGAQIGHAEKPKAKKTS